MANYVLLLLLLLLLYTHLGFAGVEFRSWTYVFLNGRRRRRWRGRRVKQISCVGARVRNHTFPYGVQKLYEKIRLITQSYNYWPESCIRLVAGTTTDLYVFAVKINFFVWPRRDQTQNFVLKPERQTKQFESSRKPWLIVCRTRETKCLLNFTQFS